MLTFKDDSPLGRAGLSLFYRGPVGDHFPTLSGPPSALLHSSLQIIHGGSPVSMLPPPGPGQMRDLCTGDNGYGARVFCRT